MDDELTIRRGKHFEVKQWQLKERKQFAADIENLTRQECCGITAI